MAKSSRCSKSSSLLSRQGSRASAERDFSREQLLSYQQLVREAVQIQERAESLERDVASLARGAVEAGDSDGNDAEEAIQELQTRTQRLVELRLRMCVIEAEVIKALEEMPGLATCSTGPQTVSFSDDNLSVKYPEDPLKSLQFPHHGHWVPRHVVNENSDLEFKDETASRQLGGRAVQLETGPEHLGTVECILVEPMGKYVNPDSFSSAGLVVCLHGMPTFDEVLEEWGKVLKSTRLLDAGLSFAMPDLPASASILVGDLHALILAALAAAGASSCVIFGKDWGGPKALQIAAEEEGPLAGRISGLVLLTPSSPVPEDACEGLEIPVLAVWAKDDQENVWENSEEWRVALATTQAPVVWAVPDLGGHNLARVMAKEERVAETVLHFTVCLHILSMLSGFLRPEAAPAKKRYMVVESHLGPAPTTPGWQADARARYSTMLRTQTIDELDGRAGSDVAHEELLVPPLVYLLCEELPSFLACQLEEDPEMGLAAAVESVCCRKGARRAACSLSVVLRSWLRTGMRQVSSVKE